MRKIAMRRLIRGEKGYVLIAALLVLVVMGLISGPVLSYMVSGLRAGHVLETGAAELYAADAGVEDAVLKIQRNEVVLCPGNPAHSYNITDINGKSVDITISSEYGVGNLTMTYRVVSTATGDGSGTEIEAYVVGVSKYGDYTGLLGQVLTSQGEIILKPNTEVNPPEGENGPYPYYPLDWPDTPEEVAEFVDFYWQDVKNGEKYYSDTIIDLAGTDRTLGPLYVDGELRIRNSSNTPATLTLIGTIYSTGKTSIAYGTAQNKPMTLDLNGRTIFVESDSMGSGQEAFKIGDKCTLIGSGVILAVGDIYFKPNTQSGVTDPIFTMSILGMTSVQPGGDFYGAIAGSVEIELQPGTSINYPQDEGWYGNLNFLIGIKKLIFHIDSWEVSRL